MIFIVALFLFIKNRKWPGCPSVDEWIKRRKKSSVHEKFLVRQTGTREEHGPYLRHRGLVQPQKAHSPVPEGLIWQWCREKSKHLEEERLG